MKNQSGRHGDAKLRLILAAIRLLAENGVDAISLREINREAGSRNNSALHYHFGSKMGLIEAVDEFIQDHFDELRRPQLAALKKADPEPSIRQIMQVFVRPYVQIIEQQEWGFAAVRTICRMEFDRNEEVRGLLKNSAGRTVRRFSEMLRPLAPHLSERLFNQRFNFITNAVIHAFADFRNLDQSYVADLSSTDLEELAGICADMGATLLQAPAD